MNTKDSNTKQPCIIHVIKRSCSCGKNWTININRQIKEHEPFICNKCGGCVAGVWRVCGGCVTVDKVLEGMKFKERLGTLNYV